ncbi:hypothetical protein Pmani_033943 [Petrolisthes manimaculis]|uniref:Uncharacterized protein n=1 Tax=Petrolisthes manimaculis TaxID=1843537 RepID=A0AAE1NNJ4_9EUCA|nr:hypothetical protein Pmani_033943 [Petrolisthes manimaculis]
MFSLAKRPPRKKGQPLVISVRETPVKGSNNGDQPRRNSMYIVSTSMGQKEQQQQQKGKGSRSSTTRGFLQRLRQRGTVTPEACGSSSSYDQGSPLPPLSTDDIPGESLDMQYFDPSPKKDKETKGEITSTTSTTNEDENDNEMENPNEDQQYLEFQLFVHEAITTLDNISAERKRLPWWERTLLYLKSVWENEPIPSRSPSRLLFWHTEAEEGHHISNTPRANGEYVVSYENMPTFHKPNPRSMHSFVTLLPNGKSAWAGKAGDRKRASDAQRRWNKNKVGDGGAGLEKRPDGKYRQTGVVNIVLYVGLGLIALGLTITFVGMGEHGFKSKELRLIGPSLIGCGFLFCLLRLFFCSAPTCCPLCCSKGKPLDEKSLLSPSRETLADDATEEQIQQHAQRQQQRAQQEGQQENQEQQQHQLQQQQQRENDVPHRLHTYDEDEPQEREARRVTAKSVHRVQSTIPNLIEDECEDDAALGLHVEYMDEVSDVVTPRQRLGAGSLSSSRASSAHSRLSTASNKLPRLPDIHSNGRPERGEIVLNPATLEGGVD